MHLVAFPSEVYMSVKCMVEYLHKIVYKSQQENAWLDVITEKRGLGGVELSRQRPSTKIHSVFHLYCSAISAWLCGYSGS